MLMQVREMGADRQHRTQSGTYCWWARSDAGGYGFANCV